MGYSLVLTDEYVPPADVARSMLASGDSLLELSVLQDANPWNFVQFNDLEGTWNALPGDALLLPGGGGDGPSALPGTIEGVEVAPLPLEQGRTGVMIVNGDDGLSLSGSLMGNDLNFFQDQSENIRVF